MLLKELIDLKNCTTAEGEQCPFLDDGCPGAGMHSTPDGDCGEPRCVELNYRDEDDMEKLYDEYTGGNYRAELAEDKRIAKQEEKERKNKIAADKRRAYKYRHYDELQTMKKLKKYKINITNLFSFTNNLVTSINFTNEMFERAGNCSHPKNIDNKEAVDNYNNECQGIDKKINDLQNKIKEDEKRYKCSLHKV